MKARRYFPVILVVFIISCDIVFCTRGYVPRSCSEAPKPCSGTKKNYLIDPDGHGQGQPFTVECDFSETPPATILHHNREARTYVKGYDAMGSYSKTLTYEADLATVKIFVDNAQKCTQFLKYECHHSILTNYGWFVNRSGLSVKNYFGGGNYSIGGCACYATNTCPKGKCNCDMNDNTWRKDEGNVDRKNDLPITGIKFGDTGGATEKGYHTIGPLKCYFIAETVISNTFAEHKASGKVLKSHTSKTIAMPSGSARLCGMHCFFDPSCWSYSVTESKTGNSLCRLNTCNGDDSLTTEEGGSYYIVYRI